MPSACNVPSRTIFTGDNLDILRGINSECVADETPTDNHRHSLYLVTLRSLQRAGTSW